MDGGYHVSVLHKDLTAGLDIDSYKTEVEERFSMQKVKGSDSDNEQADRLGKKSGLSTILLQKTAVRIALKIFLYSVPYPVSRF